MIYVVGLTNKIIIITADVVFRTFIGIFVFRARGPGRR
jgi:hypothetical protein